MTPILSKLLLLLYIGATETIMVDYAFRRLLTRNNRSRTQYLIALLIYAGCTIFDATFNFPIYFVFIFCYVLITAISFLFYDNPNEIRLIVPFIFVAMNYSATIFATTLIWALTSGDISAYPHHLQQNFLSQTLLYGFFTLFTLLMSWLHNIKNRSDSFMIILYIFIPLGTIVLLVKLFYLGTVPLTENSLLANHITIGGLLFLAAITLFFLADRVNSMYESLTYSATLEQMLAMQEKYYASLEEHQQELRRINHDIKNHNRSIISLISQEKYDEAIEYVESISMDVHKVVPVTDCNNQLLGSLLNDKLGGLKEKNVDLSLCVMVPTVLNIKNVDLCILLGNLLDNAVDACERMKDPSLRKFIDVDIRLKGSLLCVRVQNSYNGKLNYAKERYLTTKPDTVYHGIGLSNVKRVVEKYYGRLTVTHKDNVFTATAFLYYPEEAGTYPMDSEK